MKKSVRRLVAGLAICFTFTVGAAAAGPDLEKAAALMREGKAAEAYVLLEPFEFEQAGNVQFDYLLGIAALDSGKPDKATLIFERVLAVDPNFAGARLDMARAYFQLGDHVRAKAEFETVLSQNPPAGARAAVEKYLAAIEQAEKAKRARFVGYVEGILGRDNNVNNSTSQNQIAVPALGNLLFTLNPTNVKTADSYLGVGAGGEVTHQLIPGLSLYAGGDVRHRSHDQQDRFDFLSADGRVGLVTGDAQGGFRFGFTGGKRYQDAQTQFDNSGANVEWRRMLDGANQLSLFGQAQSYRFGNNAIATSVNNFNQSGVGGTWLRALGGGKGVVFASLTLGTESAIERADGGKRFHGARVGGQLNIHERADVFAAVGAQFGKFDKLNAAFLATREDDQYDFTVGLNYRLEGSWAGWSVRPMLSYSRNDSNIGIYEYDRTDVFVALRRDFK